jgi:SAM-dependent methyltransferase
VFLEEGFIHRMRPDTQTAAKTPRDQMTANCPACAATVGGETIEVRDHEYGLRQIAQYLECGACGTLFQEPMPTLAELAAFYPSDYHSMTHAGLLNKIRNDMRIRRLSKLVIDEGVILDYGCGDGAFMVQAAKKLLRRRFWGFEISDRTETSILVEGRVTLVRGSLRDLLAILPGCGLITLNHVIEHLPDPLGVVKALADRLLPGGIFEGQTPASDSLERSVFGKKWSGYHAPRHTVIFSRGGLCCMLERSGLSTPSVLGAFNPAALAVSLGSLPRKERGRIRRSGWKWFTLIALAGGLAPIDLWSGRPGIINFIAFKRPR